VLVAIVAFICGQGASIAADRVRMAPMDAIRSERLLLRRLAAGDADALAAYRSDPEVARYQSWDTPFSTEEARSLIADFAGADVDGPGWFQWAVERVDEPGIIGDLGVNLLDDGKQAEIGYTIAPAFQGCGYGSEAITRMVDHLLVDRRLHRVSAECDTRNEASLRLLERLGFRREGHRRSSTWSKGEWTDDYLYAVLSHEWPRP
jgi:aminoglycoside 6'-N-acetyltransferase